MTPTIPSPIVDVAVAPDPSPKINTLGAIVYPNPGLITSIDCTDFVAGFALSVQTTIPPIKVAEPIPVTPPPGAEDIATLGEFMYPLPRFVTVKNLIPPFTRVVIALAVTPVPTIFNFCIIPTCAESCSPPLPPILSSIISIPVSITPSSYLNSSHFKV